MSDGALVYLDHTGHGMRLAAVSMFICIGFDFVTGVLTFIAASHSRRF